MRQYSLTLCDNLDRRTNYIGVSALHGFSLTTGRLEIICGKINICFEIDNSLSPLIASFHYIKNLGIGQDKLPYLRLIFSAQEVDDALKLTGERTNSIKSTLKIYYKDID